MGEKGNLEAPAGLAERAADLAAGVAGTATDAATGVVVGMATTRAEEHLNKDEDEDEPPTSAT